jgi:hypothetical protein
MLNLRKENLGARDSPYLATCDQTNNNLQKFFGVLHASAQEILGFQDVNESQI